MIIPQVPATSRVTNIQQPCKFVQDFARLFRCFGKASSPFKVSRGSIRTAHLPTVFSSPQNNQTLWYMGLSDISDCLSELRSYGEGAACSALHNRRAAYLREHVIPQIRKVQILLEAHGKVERDLESRLQLMQQYFPLVESALMSCKSHAVGTLWQPLPCRFTRLVRTQLKMFRPYAKEVAAIASTKEAVAGAWSGGMDYARACLHQLNAYGQGAGFSVLHNQRASYLRQRIIPVVENSIRILESKVEAERSDIDRLGIMNRHFTEIEDALALCAVHTAGTLWQWYPCRFTVLVHSQLNQLRQVMKSQGRLLKAYQRQLPQSKNTVSAPEEKLTATPYLMQQRIELQQLQPKQAFIAQMRESLTEIKENQVSIERKIEEHKAEMSSSDRATLKRMERVRRHRLKRLAHYTDPLEKIIGKLESRLEAGKHIKGFSRFEKAMDAFEKCLKIWDYFSLAECEEIENAFYDTIEPMTQKYLDLKTAQDSKFRREGGVRMSTDSLIVFRRRRLEALEQAHQKIIYPEEFDYSTAVA